MYFCILPVFQNSDLNETPFFPHLCHPTGLRRFAVSRQIREVLSRALYLRRCDYINGQMQLMRLSGLQVSSTLFHAAHL